MIGLAVELPELQLECKDSARRLPSISKDARIQLKNKESWVTSSNDKFHPSRRGNFGAAIQQAFF